MHKRSAQKIQVKKHADEDDVEKSLDVMTKRIETLELQLKQTLSDYNNLKHDMDKRLDFERELILAGVLKSIIGVADDIDVAVDHVDDEKGWREGITLILEKFHTVIEDMGAKIIECKEGDVFDPQRHEAIGVVPGSDEGMIAKVLQNGYVLADMVVRPARVLVFKNNKISSNAK